MVVPLDSQQHTEISPLYLGSVAFGRQPGASDLSVKEVDGAGGARLTAPLLETSLKYSSTLYADKHT